MIHDHFMTVYTSEEIRVKLGSLGLSSHSFGHTPLPQRFNYILSYFRDINLGGMFGAGAVQKWMCDVTENANVS